MLRIVSTPAKSHAPPLDFDELPKTPEAIPLERHGVLLLLAARSSASILFAGVATPRMPVYPDLAVILINFAGSTTAADEEAQALYDSLLALTVLSSSHGVAIEEPASEKQYFDFVLALTKCSSRQSYNALRNVPANIVHSHPSETVRFRLLQEIFSKEELLYARESAIGWLKNEILRAAEDKNKSNFDSIFLDPRHVSTTLFTALYNTSTLDSLDTSTKNIAISWLRFTQSLAPYLHAALNLYYVIISSAELRAKLEISTASYPSFRKEFVERLKSTCHAFEEDLVRNGGDGHIEAVVGEEMCQVGMARSVGLLFHVLEQLEGKAGEVF